MDFWEVALDFATGGAYTATKTTIEAGKQIVGATAPTGSLASGLDPRAESAGAHGSAPAPAAGNTRPTTTPNYGTPVTGQPAGAAPSQPANGCGATGAAAGAVYGAAPVGDISVTCSDDANIYAIEGECLLNRQTGQVWFIDKSKMELRPFARRQGTVESAAHALRLEAAKQYLLEGKDMGIARLPHAMRGVMSEQVGELIKAIDREIVDHRRAAGAIAK